MRIPPLVKEAIARGDHILMLWPGTKTPCEPEWPRRFRSEEELQAEFRRLRDDPERKMPARPAFGRELQPNEIMVDLDSPDAREWLEAQAAGRGYETRETRSVKGSHLTYINSTGKKFLNASKIGGVPLDIRAQGGIEKIQDWKEPERGEVLSDVEPQPIPKWLVPHLPVRGEKKPSAADDDGEDLELFRLIREGIPQGRQDVTMTRLALSLRNQGCNLKDWMAIAQTVLAVSKTGKVPFDRKRVAGWWKSADSKVLDEEESLFTYVDMSTVGMPAPAVMAPSDVSISDGVNYIFGQAGDGKTRLVYWDILERIRAGERWALYDREMGPERFRLVMTELGATEEEICSVAYIATADTPDLIRHGHILIEQLQRDGYDGIAYDCMAVFLGASNIQENDQTGIRRWIDSACRGMKKAWIIDHAGHENADHGRGASAKIDAVDFGVHLIVNEAFSAGVDGSITLKVVKDRSGTMQKMSVMDIDIKTSEAQDGIHPMTFDPGFWGKPKTTDKTSMSVLDILNDILSDGADYATAGQLQAEMPGTHKGTKLKKIREAVKNGEITLEKVGTTSRYRPVDKVRMS